MIRAPDTGSPKSSSENRDSGLPPGPTIELHHILAPVDFSPASRHGLAFAATVAERFHARLHLLHVIEPPSLPEWGYAHLAIRDTNLRRAAEQRLPTFSMECPVDPGLIQSAAVRTGDADSQICLAASESKADLIILASHGLGGLPHALIGSTVERVVRHAPCPVLTVCDRALTAERAPAKQFDLKRILVTTDFSEASKSALAYGAALARTFDASLTLLYVVPAHLPADIGHLGIVWDEERLISEARKRLPQFREAELATDLRVETMVANGGPAHEIGRAAQTQAADLIVISTHGHTGLKHLLLGSVTESVVRHAPCPVLVVREREREFIKAWPQSLGSG